MTQITANAHVFPELRSGSHTGYVATSEGVVMIDTPMLPTDAVQLRDEIAAMGEVRYIANTHHHYDHIAGNYFFSGTVIGHDGLKEMYSAPIVKFIAYPLTEKGDTLEEFIRLRLEERDPEGIPLLKQYRLRPPTITFNDRLTLHLGKHTFEVIHLPGHTANHIGVYVPEEKVFFAGDNFTNGVQPSLAQCEPREWVESLKKILALDVDVIVAGHGEPSGNKEDVRKFLAFLQKCIDSVQDAIKLGLSKEDTIKNVSFAELYAIHRGDAQHRMNVSRLYEKLSNRIENM
jgi:cyclase